MGSITPICVEPPLNNEVYHPLLKEASCGVTQFVINIFKLIYHLFARVKAGIGAFFTAIHMQGAKLLSSSDKLIPIPQMDLEKLLDSLTNRDQTPIVLSEVLKRNGYSNEIANLYSKEVPLNFSHLNLRGIVF